MFWNKKKQTPFDTGMKIIDCYNHILQKAINQRVKKEPTQVKYQELKSAVDAYIRAWALGKEVIFRNDENADYDFSVFWTDLYKTIGIGVKFYDRFKSKLTKKYKYRTIEFRISFKDGPKINHYIEFICQNIAFNQEVEGTYKKSTCTGTIQTGFYWSDSPLINFFEMLGTDYAGHSPKEADFIAG